MMAIVTAGVGTDEITMSSVSETVHKISTINTMLFIDSNFADGALVSGLMAATEAKVRALQDLHIVDRIDTGTSTDTLLIGLTQQGKKISSAGSRTGVGKGIGQMVYRAIKEALSKQLLKVQST